MNMNKRFVRLTGARSLIGNKLLNKSVAFVQQRIIQNGPYHAQCLIDKASRLIIHSIHISPESVHGRNV